VLEMANKKVTKEEFLKRSKAKHGDKYDYSMVDYVDSKTKIKIICRTHGVFEQTPQTHYRSGCRSCSNDELLGMTQDEFIDQSNKKHHSKYDYSLVQYRSKLEEVDIICPTHGKFKQLPKLHLKGHGCGWCGGAWKYTKEMFVVKARAIHGDKYNYDDFEYISFETKSAIICLMHGRFMQTPANHFAGNGCAKCGLKSRNDSHRTKLDVFIKKAREVHGLKFDYSRVGFKKLKDKVEIGCPYHGLFKQDAASHLRGSTCPTCLQEDCRGYSREAYIRTCQEYGDGTSNLYAIKCFCDDEVFYKVGITKEANIAKRFAYGKMPYEFEVIAILNGEAGFIYDIETQIHRLLRAHKYIPIKDFAGKQECFTKLPISVLRMLDGIERSNQIQLIT